MGGHPSPRVAPRRRRPTALELVQEQYVRGERDLDGLERGVAWLLLHGLDETPQRIAPHWPPSARWGDPADALPSGPDPSLVYEIERG